MHSIVYIDRVSKKKETEKVFGGKALQFLYGDDLISRLLGSFVLNSLAKTSFFASLYGQWQKLALSKKKIKPFISNFSVDTTEFRDPVDSFRSFNEFFIRKLKPDSRPIAPGDHTVIIPADGRYYFYQDISKVDGFIVKGRKFDLGKLLNNRELASRYQQGSMLMARLCPTDYHRFHFPCDCIPSKTQCINGWLYSVNPIAVKKNIEIFTENKRTICELETQQFGKVLYLEIGATNVGSIIQTYQSGQFQPKGAEKGYFSFGGSALILLFEPNRIIFDQDLVAATTAGYEIRCLMGQSLGIAE